MLAVLFILIPTAWLAAVAFALIMCRVAAFSDDSHAVEVAAWLAANYHREHPSAQADSLLEQLPFDLPRAAYRGRGRS